MNDLLSVLARRRSAAPRSLSDPGPDKAQIQTLLTLASRVPDHGKLAPWRFIVFEGEGRKRAGDLIAAAFAADEPDADGARIEAERTRLSHAPLVVGIVSRARPHVKIPEWEQVLSAGAACMNLVVAANVMGFSTAWLTEWYAFDRRVLDGLGLHADESIAGFVHIGTSSEAVPDRPRPALADIVTIF